MRRIENVTCSERRGGEDLNAFSLISHGTSENSV
jgi:hypothetical protein